MLRAAFAAAIIGDGCVLQTFNSADGLLIFTRRADIKGRDAINSRGNGTVYFNARTGAGSAGVTNSPPVSFLDKSTGGTSQIQNSFRLSFGDESSAQGASITNAAAAITNQNGWQTIFDNDDLR